MLNKFSRFRYLSIVFVCGFLFFWQVLPVKADTYTQPGLNIEFFPISISAGGESTLTITIYNPNTSIMTLSSSDYALADTLPAGMYFTSPAVVTNSCGGTLTVIGTTITLIGGSVPAEVITPGKCSFSVKVTSITTGNLVNVISPGSLKASIGITALTNPTEAKATLAVNAVSAPSLSKTFEPNTIYIGQSSLLTIKIKNNDINTDLTSVSITDTLPANMIVDTTPEASQCGGTVTSTATSVTLTNGTVPKQVGTTAGVCNILVRVTSLTPGVYTNLLPPNVIVDQQGVTNSTAASAPINVQAIGLAKSFTPSSVPVNSISLLRITFQNPSGSAYSHVSITDNLPNGVTISTGPSASQCSGTVSYTSTSISLNEGIIPAASGSPSVAGTCTISAYVTSSIVATYTNTIPAGSMDAQTPAGRHITNVMAASANVGFYGGGYGLGVSKSFTPGTMPVKGTSLLTIRLSAPADTTLTSFNVTDALPAGLLVASTTNAKLGDYCSGGTFSPVPGGSRVTYTGGTIAAGKTCILEVSVTSSIPGVYTNTISPANISNAEHRSISTYAWAQVTVSGISVSKNFYPSTIEPDGISTLTITLGNTNTNQIDLVTFTDTLPGNPLENDYVEISNPSNSSTTCSGASITAEPGTQAIQVSGAIIPAQVAGVPGICTIMVDVVGRGSAVKHTNKIKKDTVTGKVHGTSVIITNPEEAASDLTISPIFIGVVKGFSPVEISGNSTSTLSFELSNPQNSVLNGIAFEDNLPQRGLGGMMVARVPNISVGTCGGTMIAAPGDIKISYSGGSLGANEKCTISVSVTMDVENNLTNTIGIGAVTTTNGAKNPEIAEASLTNLPGVSISKYYSPNSILAGDISTLSFQIVNTGNIQLTGMGFSDTLQGDLVIAPEPNAVSTCDLPANDPPVVSSLTAEPGTNIISLSGAGIAGSQSCIVQVDVTGPVGRYQNTIPVGGLTAFTPGDGFGNDILTVQNAEATTDTLLINRVVDPPVISKSFSTNPVLLNSSTALVFTITNPSSNTVGLTGVNFTDTLPDGLTLSSIPNTVQCNGVVSSTNTSISLSGGSIPVNSSCAVTASVTSAAAGSYTNTTGNVSSTNGGAGNSAQDILLVAAPPVISKSFSTDPSTTPAAINAGGVSTLTLTLSNPVENPLTLTGVSVTDELPFGLNYVPGTELTTCTSGVLSADTTKITLTAAEIDSGNDCTVSVQVTGSVGGTFLNVTGAVSSANGGIGNTASDSLTVNGPGLSLEKSTTSKGFQAVDDSIPYKYILTNTGNVNLYPPFAVTDDKANSVPCPQPTLLLPNDTLECNVIYLAVSSDVTAGSITNTATASAQDAETGGNTVTSNTSSVTVDYEALDLLKTTSTSSYRFEGDKINYIYTLTNIGNVSLYPPYSITDNKISGITCPVTPAVLTSGMSVNCQVRYTVTADDVTAGTVINTAHASAKDAAISGRAVLSNDSSVTVYRVVAPEITKSFSPERIIAGTSSVLTFTITNPATNSIPLLGVKFSDTFPVGMVLAVNPSASQCGGTVAYTTNSISFSGGSVIQGGTCTVDVVVTSVEKGTYTNTSGNVESTNGGKGNMATAYLEVVVPPAISKAFSPVSILKDGDSMITFTLTNPNDTTTLTGVAFEDDLPAGLEVASVTGLQEPVTPGCDASGDAPTFAPLQGDKSLSFSGGSIQVNGTCTVSVYVTGKTGGKKDNTTLAVTSVEGGTGSPSNTASLWVDYPEITLVKSISSGNYYENVHDTVQYAYQITNTGSVTLVGAGTDGVFVVTDDKTTVTCPATPNGLEPAAFITCTSMYSVTQTDIDYGSVENTAQAFAKFGSNVISSAIVKVRALEAPQLEKEFTTTEINNSNNLAGEAAIGELVTYKLTLTVPKGITRTGILTDVMDDGLAFYDVQSVTYPSGVTSVNTIGTGSTPAAVTISDSGSGINNRVVFSFGNITNSNTDYDTQQKIIIVYRAKVSNLISNQAGSLLSNNAGFSWSAGSVAQKTITDSVKVIEPSLSLAKTMVGDAGKDAADITTYKIVISNGNSASDTDAYNVVLSDSIPEGMSLVLPVDGGTCTADFSGSTTSAITGTWSAITKDTSCEFTFTTKLNDVVLPAQTIAGNSAELRWSSMAGSVTGERSGPSGAIGSDTLDNYGVESHTSEFTLDDVILKKVMIASSEAHTTDPYAAIGEIIRYRLVMQLPESTVQNLQFSDIFSGTGGQRFLNDGTERFRFVGNGGVHSYNDNTGTETIPAACNSGGDSNNTGTFTINEMVDTVIFPSSELNCSLSDANISTDQTVNEDTFDTNTPVYFKFGKIINNDSDLNAEYIVAEFNTIVTNEAVNIGGHTLTDSFSAQRWDGSGLSTFGTAASGIELIVHEPDLSVTKIIKSPIPSDAGDTVTYEITITAAGTADDHAAAFDLSLTDTLDASLDPVSQTITGTTQAETCAGDGSGTTAFSDLISRTNQVVTLTAACLDPGKTITAEITAVVKQNTAAGSIIPNQADLVYTSLPGVHGTTTNNTGSAVIAAPGSDTGERTGSGTAPNTYKSVSSKSFTVTSPSLVKVDASKASYTIGETVNYDIRVTLPEGLTPDLVVTDLIPSGIKTTGSKPYGLKYVSSQVLASEFNGTPDVTLLSGVCANTCSTGDDVTFTLGDITTTNDNLADNNTIIIRMTLLVENLDGNQDISVANSEYPATLVNAATAAYTGGTLSDSAAAIRIVEPEITTLKTLAETTSAATNNVLHYTARFTNTGNSTAYDVTAQDVMAPGVIFGAISSCNYYNGTDSASIGFTQPAAGLTTISIEPDIAGGWDIPVTTPNSYIECAYTAIVQNTMIINGVHTNTVDADWSSLNGVQANERSYDDSTSYNFDGTQDTSTASFTTDLPALSKSDGAITTAAIGDTVHYTLTVGGANVLGTLRSLVLVDTLPAGLIYNGNEQITGLSGTPTVVVSTPNDGSLPVTITFTFGDTVKNTANASIQFDTRLADTTVNVKDGLKTNLVNGSYKDTEGNTVNFTQASDSFTVTEPVITTTKNSNKTASVKAGDTLSYTVRFTNTGNSTAYDVTAEDVMAPGVTFGAITSCNYYNGSGTASIGYTQPVSGLSTIAIEPAAAGGWDIPVTTPNSYIECVYTGIVQNSMVINGNHTNTVDADWTSQNGVDNLNERIYADGATPASVDGSQDTASVTFTTDVPGLSKSDGSITTRTVGDSLHYTLSLTGANVIGTLKNLVVTDTLPVGLVYDGNVTITDLSPSPTVGVSATNNGTTAVTITFTFGDTVKSASNGTIEFDAHLADNAANVNKGGTKNNSVSASYKNVANGNVALGPATDGFTIIEPVITTTKNVNKTASVRAGDTLTYTVRFTNTGNSPAYDVTAEDILAPGVTFGAITSCNYFNGASTSSIGFTQPASGLTTVPLGPAAAGGWDILVTATKSYIECVYTANVQNSMIIDGSHANSVDADWTSQDGTGNASERSYADAVSRTNVDGVQDTAAVSFTTDTPTLAKSHDLSGSRTVGDSIHYTITIGGANVLGTLKSLVVTDTLPAGLVYDGGLLVTGLTGTPVVGIGTPNDGSAAVSVTFTFGDTVKSISNAAIEFDAHVADNPVNINKGGTKTNSVSAVYKNTANINTTIGPVTDSITIIEPVITTIKSVSPTSSVKAGDTLTYTVRFTNTGDSIAYDVTAQDVMAQGVTFESITSCSYFNGTTTVAAAFTQPSSGLTTVSITPFVSGAWDLPVTGYIECIYTGKAQSSLHLDGDHTNTVDADWSSQDGTENSSDRSYADAVARTSVDGSQDTAAATFTAGVPSITKASDSETAVIGQTVHFSLSVNSPLGTLRSAKVVDSLPAGYIYVAGSQVVSTENVSTPVFTPSGSVNGTAAVTLTWDFSDAVVTSSPFTIEYDAIAANVSNNQNYTLLTNTAALTYNSAGGISQTVDSNSITTTIQEPILVISKSAVKAGSTLDAGDEINYTVTIAHDTNLTLPDSTAAAYDVNLVDVLPSYASLKTGSITVDVPTVSVSDTSNTVNVLISSIPVGTTVTVTYTAILKSAVTPHQKLENTGTITWSSMTGDIRSGAFNGERDGSGGNNDYTNHAAASLYSDTLIGNKSIVSTSESHTVETGDGSNSTTQARELAVGEVMRYRLTVTLPEGTSSALTLADTLPAGLSYLGSPSIKLISDTDMTVPEDLTSAQGTAVALPAAHISVNSQDISFTLGDFVNNDTDLDSEQVQVEFNVLVSNTNDNSSGTIHNNSFTASVSSGTTVNSDHMYSVVVEPVLLLGKSAAASTNWKYGETVTYTLGVTTPVSSTAQAFDLEITDTIPAGLTYVPSSASDSLPANWSVEDSAAPVLVWTCAANCLVSGAIDLTYQVTVDPLSSSSALKGNDTVTNNARLTYTSLPGNKGTVSNSTGSSTPGASGDSNGERSGSAVGVNNYSDPAQHTGGVSQYYSIGNRVFFDTNNNGLMNGSETGVDGVLVQLYDAVDTSFTTPLASDTTAGGGFYLFDFLEPGTYVVVIPGSNFADNQVLSGYWSSGSSISSAGILSEADAVSVDTSPTDADDNGNLQTSDPIQGAIITLPVTLGGTEPTGEVSAQLRTGVGQGSQPDSRANMTVDFGFYRTELGGLLWTEGGSALDGKYLAADDIVLPDNVVRLYSGDGTTEIQTGADGVLGTSDDAAGGLTSGSDGTYLFSGLPAGKFVVKVTEDSKMISTLDSFDQPDNNNPAVNTNNNDNGDNDQEAAGLVASNPVDTVPGSTGAKSNNSVTYAAGSTTDQTLDFGFAARYAVGDTVWFDLNNNGIQDLTETGVSGVNVKLYTAGSLGEPSGSALVSVTTDSSGKYLFDNLYPGDYVVVIPGSNFSGAGVLTGYWSSLTTMISDGSTIETAPNDPDDDVLTDDNGYSSSSDVISKAITLGPIGNTEPVGEAIAQGIQPDDHANMSLDFGFFRPAVLGNLVWNDTNYNGIQDAGETGMDAVSIELYTAAGDLQDTTATDSNGIYRFTNLAAGEYYLIFKLPAGFVFSPAIAGSNIAKDSNANALTGETAHVVLSDGETNNSIDAAMYLANPVLTLLKTTTSSGYSAAGDTLPYKYNLKNDGNITLYAPYSVSDNKVTVSCPSTPAGIAPSESVDCTASYTITQADLDAGSVVNTASAKAKDKASSGSDVTSNTSTVTVTGTQTKTLTLLKTTTSSGYNAVGDSLPYKYNLKNDGNITLFAPYTVSDNKTNVSCPGTPASIAPTESVDCTASYTITQADLDAGSVVNIASAKAKDKASSGSDVTSNTSTVTVTGTQTKTLTLLKTTTSSGYSAVGDSLPYNYNLKNDGNITLFAPYSVSDNKTTVSCPSTPSSIAPAESVDCTASYSITQADLDSGSVVNTASAKAKDKASSGSDVTSNTSTVTVTGTQTKTLTLLKTTTSLGFITADTILQYKFNLKNDGNVTLFFPYSVTDNLTTVLCPSTPDRIAPTESVDCTASYSTTQADVDAGKVVNSATAKAKDKQSSGSDVISNLSTVTINGGQTPAMTVTKSSLTTGLNKPVLVNYSYNVENTGNLTLTNISLSDDNITTSMSCPKSSLLPGAAMTCTASHSFTQAELDANGSPSSGSGKLTNTVTASSDQTADVSDTLDIPITQSPSLSLLKTADPASFAKTGVTITYSYKVSNDGNITLDGPFSIDDNLLGTISCPASPASLSPGDIVTCSTTYDTTQQDLNNGSIENTASASNGQITSPVDTFTVTGSQSPALTIQKTADPAIYTAMDDVITYSYVVTNTGNTTLTGPFTVTDDKSNDISCSTNPTSLDPGAKMECTGTYTITLDDMDAGSVTNQAYVSNGTVTSPAVSKTVTADQQPVMTVDKQVTSSAPYLLGNTITFSITVSNAGNISLTGVTVEDTGAPISSCTPAQPSVLSPAQSMTCEASHVVTQADLENGTYENTASADSAETSPVTSTVTVPMTVQPVIGIAERLVDITEVGAGQADVTLEFLVKNYGNVSLGNIQVQNDLSGSFPAPAIFSIRSLTSSDFHVNTGVYNGKSVINMLKGTDTLGIGGEGKLRVVFRIIPVKEQYENYAAASGKAVSKPAVNDQSTDGTNPDPDDDGDPTNNADPTIINFNASIFDPPLGIKTFDAAQLPMLRWTMTWINETNIPALSARVSDPIIAGTLFLPVGEPGLYPVPNTAPAGSSILGVDCHAADGASGTTTTLCYYEGPTDTYPLGRIVWEGTIGPDLGAANAEKALNELYISFNVSIDPGISKIKNIASIDVDINSNGNFVDAGETDAANSQSEWKKKAAGSKKLPDTGFAANIINILPVQPADKVYSTFSDLSIEIPVLSINEDIVGVPFTDEKWDITWIGAKAGWLNGTAFPTWKGNSVLTGHVTLANGLPGPFVNVGKLKWGDTIMLHAFGQKFIYSVRNVQTVEPDDLSVIGHKADAPWVTLITCKEYDPVSKTYNKRLAVQAVLLQILEDGGKSNNR